MAADEELITRTLIEALGQAVLAAGSDAYAQPSRIRQRIEEILGSDARGLRSQIHQLIVAADERIPSQLIRSGASVQIRGKLADQLAIDRGWRPEVAAWTVQVWASTLGMDETDPETFNSDAPDVDDEVLTTRTFLDPEAVRSARAQAGLQGASRQADATDDDNAATSLDIW